MELMVVSVVVGIPVLKEDGLVTGDVSLASEVGCEGVTADVVVIPVDRSCKGSLCSVDCWTLSQYWLLT